MALGKPGIHAQKDGAGNYLTCHVNIDSTWVKSLNKRTKTVGQNAHKDYCSA